MVLADPLFWLALSFLLVVISLTAVLLVAIPTFRELGRAARSAEKFFDTLGRELPPTLEAIRLTGLEITELTDDVTEGVQSAGQVVQQVNQSLATAQTGAKRLNTGTKSFLAGARAAWQAWTDEPPAPPQKLTQPQPKQPAPPRSSDRPQPAAADAQAEDGDRVIGHANNAITNGDRPNNRPQLEETSLHTLPKPGLDAQPPERSPIWPAPDANQPSQVD
ncbi:MAG: DUF948 domain-containing protein [Nodosilinea sp.]